MAKKSVSTTIEELAVSALSPHPRNARTHSEKQIGQIARSIAAFGFTNPVLVDKANRIVAGHGRVKAAELLQLASVPCIRLEHLTEEELRAYVIADNRLAERAGWDKDLLAIELQAIIDLDANFDVTLTGFEMPEIDILLHNGAEDEDEPPIGIDRTKPSITRIGDIWEFGLHRLICGDFTLSSTYTSLLAGERADMVFTDPPYNVPIEGHVSGLGRVKHEEFAMASGEMSEAQFADFLRTIFGNLIDSSKDGALHFVCMDWRHAFEVLTAAKESFRNSRIFAFGPRTTAVWAHSIAPSMNSSSCSSQETRPTPTTSNLAGTAATGPTSGPILAPIALASIARPIWKLIPL